MKLKCSYIVLKPELPAFMLLTVLLALALPGCGIYSFSGASTTGLSSVSIQYFQNRASLVQPGLSQTITDELIDKCKA